MYSIYRVNNFGFNEWILDTNSEISANNIVNLLNSSINEKEDYYFIYEKEDNA